MLGGALVSALALVMLASQHSVAGITAGWCLAQAGLNAMQAGIAACVPDRVPLSQRGAVSGWLGAPQCVGVVLAVFLVSKVAEGSTGYLVLAVLTVALALPFVLGAQEQRLDPAQRPPFRLRAFLRSFLPSPLALFALAAVTGAAFWYLDGLMKGYQYRYYVYYVRMREIEYTAYLINRVPLGGEYGGKEISAPRIDMTWGFRGYPVNDNNEQLPLPRPWWRRFAQGGEEPKPGDDWRADEPERRSAQLIYSQLRVRFWWPNVARPDAIAVILGTALFIAAALKAPGLQQLRL